MNSLASSLLVGCLLLLGCAVTGNCRARADEQNHDDAFSAAIAAAQKRTVKIYGAGIGRSPGYATGIIVSTDGQILTASGVFLSGGNLRVGLPDGSLHPARILRRSPNLPAAVLKIDCQTPDFFPLADQPTAWQGDWILALSNAFKVADGPEPLSVNIGVISLRTRIDARRGYQDFAYEGDVYLLDAITSNPGAAGGAVVAANGSLVGMIGTVVEGNATNTRLNYAIPADVLRPYVADSKPAPANAVPLPAAKAELGIRLFALGGRKAPAYIDRILAGSPAAQAGLQSDDLIVSIGGQLVRDAGDFRRLVEALRVGEEVALEIKRKDQLLTVRVTPGAIP